MLHTSPVCSWECGVYWNSWVEERFFVLKVSKKSLPLKMRSCWQSMKMTRIYYWWIGSWITPIRKESDRFDCSRFESILSLRSNAFRRKKVSLIRYDTFIQPRFIQLIKEDFWVFEERCKTSSKQVHFCRIWKHLVARTGCRRNYGQTMHWKLDMHSSLGGFMSLVLFFFIHDEYSRAAYCSLDCKDRACWMVTKACCLSVCWESN